LARGPELTSQIRVILDFGAGFNDWRGWYIDAGA
jgi:hypothetical protein